MRKILQAQNRAAGVKQEGGPSLRESNGFLELFFSPALGPKLSFYTSTGKKALLWGGFP